MDDTHDDGLVHGHAWASEPEPARPASRRPAAPAEHDDGLVHGHGWACGERGAPVHAAIR